MEETVKVPTYYWQHDNSYHAPLDPYCLSLSFINRAEDIQRKFKYPPADSSHQKVKVGIVL